MGGCKTRRTLFLVSHGALSNWFGCWLGFWGTCFEQVVGGYIVNFDSRGVEFMCMVWSCMESRDVCVEIDRGSGMDATHFCFLSFNIYIQVYRAIMRTTNVYHYSSFSSLIRYDFVWFSKLLSLLVYCKPFLATFVVRMHVKLLRCFQFYMLENGTVLCEISESHAHLEKFSTRT